jgi:uncharacterized protein (TIGR03083 family)
MAERQLDALRISVARLHRIAEPLNESELTRPAYPRDWSIADVLSHLGSLAGIMQRRLDDALAGRETPDDAAPAVWDTWNAKAPIAKRDDALSADAALLARLGAVTAAERGRFTFAMGPMTFGFDIFLGLRINEHAMHTWDIEVAANPSATIPSDLATLVIDNLELTARFTATPTGDTAAISILTTAPDRGFVVQLEPDSAALLPTTAMNSADVELASEAFARLVYGRLDPPHTPPRDQGPALDVLRKVFSGP